MYEQLRREAEDNWTRWATTLADGGAPPEPLALLEAGGLLGLPQPADALEKDAAAIREVRDLEQRAGEYRERAAKQRKPHGTHDERRQRIAALKAELRLLESLQGVSPVLMHAGYLSGAAARIREKHPRAFRSPKSTPAQKRTTRKQKELAR